MSALRIAFVTHTYPRHPGDGAGAFLHRLACALHAAGNEVTVLAPSARGLAEAEEIERVPVRRFRYGPRAFESIAYSGTLADQVAGSIRGKGALAAMVAAGSVALHEAVAELQPDIVHAHWWFPAGLIATAGAGVTPVVTTLYGSDVQVARRSKLARPFLRRVARRSDLLTTPSEWLAGETRALDLPTAVTVIPSPAETTLFRGDRAARTAGRLLYIGRLVEGRGLEDLLEALAWTDASATLDVVGDGADFQKLRARAVSLGLDARVRWLGRVPRAEMPSVYGRAHLLVACGSGPGQGSAAIEAQLCRTPVIACRAGALPEIVHPEWGGTLVPRGRPRDLAEAIRAMLKLPPDESRGSAARARMLDRFAPSAVAAQHQSLYSRILRDLERR